MCKSKDASKITLKTIKIEKKQKARIKRKIQEGEKGDVTNMKYVTK